MGDRKWGGTGKSRGGEVTLRSICKMITIKKKMHHDLTKIICLGIYVRNLHCDYNYDYLPYMNISTE